MQVDKKGSQFAERIFWRDLSPQSVLKLTGDDASDFLQGQFSQDIRKGELGTARYGFWLDRKGKVTGDAVIVRDAETCCWVLSWSMSESAICERFESYLVADDVEIERQTDQWQGWQLVGPALGDWFGRNMDGRNPGNEFTYFAWAEPIPLRPSSYLVVGQGTPDWPREWERADDCLFERSRIAEGRARVPEDLGPGDIPQEAGLDSIGVSFKKGCYLGQEVMARVNATGRIRRRLVNVAGVGLLPNGGEEIELWQGDKKVGTLRSRIDNGAGGWWGLAMVSLSSVDFSQRASLGTAEGPQVVFDQSHLKEN
jgi:tRNA-modifying protein YgfZ